MEGDFLAVLREVAGWDLHSLIGYLTFEKIVLDTTGKQFDIVYLASHSTGTEIQIGDEYIGVEAFVNFCKSKGAKLILLGVCEGQLLANMLLDSGVETVIYWLNPVNDEHAIVFARIFFASLTEGNDVQGAVDNAKMLLPPTVGEGSLRLVGYRLLSFK